MKLVSSDGWPENCEQFCFVGVFFEKGFLYLVLWKSKHRNSAGGQIQWIQ